MLLVLFLEEHKLLVHTVQCTVYNRHSKAEEAILIVRFFDLFHTLL